MPGRKAVQQGGKYPKINCINTESSLIYPFLPGNLNYFLPEVIMTCSPSRQRNGTQVIVWTLKATGFVNIPKVTVSTTLKYVIPNPDTNSTIAAISNDQ
jgi:hypothetical protein